jgi:hypothetical protein
MVTLSDYEASLRRAVCPAAARFCRVAFVRFAAIFDRSNRIRETS